VHLAANIAAFGVVVCSGLGFAAGQGSSTSASPSLKSPASTASDSRLLNSTVTRAPFNSKADHRKSQPVPGAHGRCRRWCGIPLEVPAIAR
jgi:hypothetical protein